MVPVLKDITERRGASGEVAVHPAKAGCSA
jgi:hypothetical protein